MANQFLAWMSAGVVAAGVSAAALVGAGVALADGDGADGGGTTTTSDSTKAAEGQGDSNTKPPEDPKKLDEEKPATSGKADGDNHHIRRQHTPPRVHVRRAPAASTAANATGTKTTTTKATDPDPAVSVDNVAVTPTATPTAPSKPTVVESVATAVSSAVTTLLKPFGASTTPNAPGAQPPVWTLAAAARREFEPGAVSPSVAEAVAPVENSLTYTPPPNFSDRISLMFQDAMSFVSKVTGVSVQAVLGRVMATGTPPFFLTFGLDTQRTVWTAEDGAQWRVWEFQPADPTGKTVVAFHGGGWIYQPNVLNWLDYTNMARETGATVVVPLYPLATTEAGRATVVIPEAADFVSGQIESHGAENVSLYADSAGSTIAISAVRQLLLAGKPIPSSMVLISGSIDSTLSNPDIRNVDDPIFDVDNAKDVWKSHWFDGITDLRDPLVSPLFFEPEILEALPPTTIYVGEREILYPDTLLLHQRAVDEGAPISVVVGTGLIHDWPALGSPPVGFSQSAAVRPDIYRQLGLTEDAPLSVTEPQVAQAIPGRPTLINVVGSFAFGLFQAFERAVAGPPQVPPGSTVRVQRSTVDLDCGPGYTVDADWYFPDTEEAPTRLIYFQHGFPGSAAEYDYTAAELAERNNAIVVATSISGNLLDCYACHLGGDPMHAAVAKLFLGDRADLLASAKAAGFEGDALPERFVLVGHSGGGQLVGGAAGYFEEFAPDAEDHNLAGVILLDTSPIGGAIERGLTKIPDDIPVYTISAAPNFLNSKGAMNRALVAARPGEFVGVELVNGMHSDALQTHNPLVLIGGQIAGLGFSRPENVQAVQVIAQGWINDFYEGTHTGVYGALGSTVDIPGTDGAQAHVLPTPAPKLTIVDLIVDAALRSTLLLKNFAVCAEDPSSTFSAAANPELTENSTADTALSLDGKGSTGQSVGQRCMKKV
ncbi:acetyl esterase/lipase/pimeloyl-ACP methyl ester carboxylesterase [Mycobacterium sp. OAS707]|uniref:alpha/beta hydrolase n=1 Tax=Mycobacterium sp. OAS707 TaxID=2663822 RepID=UPI00178BE526|nr:alpha/beta hydrolase fold domain-containing protein [Mycobacterium sp. OAS707]MBE1547905.1 acetyl esterase/lipase/pimeloyl-ACP methyl ester carboxylesterase [Mycobacterium sp. OAS707]